MKFQPVFKAAPSPVSDSYVAYHKGYSQVPGDGNTTVLDYSPRLNACAIGASTSYAAVTANTGWLTATSGAGLRSWVLPAGAFSSWDLNPGSGLAKSLILAFQFKSATAPSISADFIGNSGGSLAGLKLTVNTAGRLSATITDTAHPYISGAGSNASICDGAEHNIVLMIDGPGKKIYLQVDGVTINGNYGTSIAVVTGSTANSSTFGFGTSGNGATWDAGGSPTSANCQMRNTHMLLLDTFPANFADILAYLAVPKNLFDFIPKSLVP